MGLFLSLRSLGLIWLFIGVNCIKVVLWSLVFSIRFGLRSGVLVVIIVMVVLVALVW